MAIFALISLFSGCGDTEEELGEAGPFYNAEANEALAKAEKAMKEAGIEANFSEPSAGNLRATLPKPLEIVQFDPLEIVQLDKQQKMEEAIGALYTALDALGESVAVHGPGGALMAGSARVSDTDGVSDADLSRIHLRLAYCYVSAAVSRLARGGIGPDGVFGTADDLYYVSFPEELKPENPEVYRFMLTDKGRALMDSVDPDDPYGYIKVFYDEGQVEALQAIIDSVSLLLCAEVSVIENAAEGIKAHEMQLDRQMRKRDAFCHLVVLGLAKEIPAELRAALGGFNETVTEHFAKPLLGEVVKWGLELPKQFEVFLDQ
jgi:hypothetical protein